ncbi:MAG: hypothetical protein IJ316_04430 [Clostridia bacterium]|nr:hypothetical protein [Clostridia bacterium]
MSTELNFRESVKANLRAFLFTQKYDCDEFGSFKTENGFHSLAELRREINAKYSKLCDDEKLRRTLSDEYNYINDVFFLSKLCERFNFPIEKILTEEIITREDAISIMEKRKTQYAEVERFAPLTKVSHASYLGEYFGYTFVHKRADLMLDDNSILKFKLSILPDEKGNIVAKYTFFTQKNKENVFIGTPYYIEKTETIFISMATSDNKRYQYLYFHGVPHKDPVIYKSGVCVRTCSTYSPHEPDVKSFIITPFELPEEIVSTLLPGILKPTGNEFYIRASELEKLKTENSLIRDLHEKHAAYFQLIDDAVYSVKDSKLLRNCDSKEDAIFAFEQLSIIKQFSLSPNRLIHPNTNAELSFFESIAPPVD